jgi:hypothetical protein
LGVLLVWGQPFAVQATTIVAIRTPAGVTFAADSAGTFRGHGSPESIRPVCKIYQDGQAFFAVAGLVHDPPTNFSVPKIVVRSTQGAKSIQERGTRFGAQIQRDIASEIQRLKASDPAGYKKLTTEPGAVTVIFGGVEKGIPVVNGVSIDLSLARDGTIQTTLKHDNCPGNCPNGVRMFYAGQTEHIERALHSGAVPSVRPPDIARFLVQLEIDARSPGVGGPIDILDISSGGPRWAQRKETCPSSIE